MLHAQLVSSFQLCLTQHKLREITEWASLYERSVVLRGKRAGECIGEVGFPVILSSVKTCKTSWTREYLEEGEGIQMRHCFNFQGHIQKLRGK